MARNGETFPGRKSGFLPCLGGIRFDVGFMIAGEALDEHCCNFKDSPDWDSEWIVEVLLWYIDTMKLVQWANNNNTLGLLVSTAC